MGGPYFGSLHHAPSGILLFSWAKTLLAFSQLRCSFPVSGHGFRSLSQQRSSSFGWAHDRRKSDCSTEMHSLTEDTKTKTFHIWAITHRVTSYNSHMTPFCFQRNYLCLIYDQNRYTIRHSNFQREMINHRHREVLPKTDTSQILSRQKRTI